MIQRLRRRFQSGLAPAQPGQRIFFARDDTWEAARKGFSRLPFYEDLPSTALQEALPEPESQDGAMIASFLRVLGRLPSRRQLAVTHLATWDCGDYLQEYVAFQSTHGQMVPAYVLVTKNISSPRPAIVAIHGHGGNFLWGKSKVTATMARRPTYGYGISLVRQGFVVLAPDLLGFEDRSFSAVVRPGPWNPDIERLLFGNLLLEGATLLGWHLFELSHAIDYLHTREDVEPKSIGVIGHSMGGSLAPLLALFDRRIQAVVASCGVGTWKTMMTRHVIHNLSCYAPGLLQEVGDLDRLLGAVSPRPFKIIAGEQDDNFPVQGVRQVAEALKARYAASGAEQALSVHIHSDGHLFGEAQQVEAVAFLQRWLPVHIQHPVAQP